MTNDRLTRLVHEAAERAAPDTLDLWPAIRARLDPRPVPTRTRGGLTLAVVAVVVLAVAGVFLLLPGGDEETPLQPGARAQGTKEVMSPTFTPFQPTEATPADAQPITATLIPSGQGPTSDAAPENPQGATIISPDWMTITSTPFSSGQQPLTPTIIPPDWMTITGTPFPANMEVQAETAPFDSVPTPVPYSVPYMAAYDCQQYPVYCVPQAGGSDPTSPIANFERSRLYGIAGQTSLGVPGVVRGIANGLPFIGDPTAPVTFLVFQDFACPHCAEYHAGDLRRFMQEQVLAGNASLQIALTTGTGGESSNTASQVALCAGEQGAFWEMSEELFELGTSGDLQTVFALPTILERAASLGLDPKALQACVEDGRYRGTLAEHEELSRSVQLSGIPSMFVSHSPIGTWIISPGQPPTIQANLPGTWTEIQRDYESMRQQIATPGAAVTPTPQAITAEEFLSGYLHGGQLTQDEPRDDYLLNVIASEPMEPTSGWAVARVDSGYVVPALSVSNYYTRDGAILFPPYVFSQSEIPISVDGYVTKLPGDYTLRLNILDTWIDFDVEQTQRIVLPARTPEVIRFTGTAGEIVRLTVAVSSGNSPLIAPEIALILPQGQTLARFNLAQANVFSTTITLTRGGDQLILINPLDICPPGQPLEDCPQFLRSNITLDVTLERQSVSETLPANTVAIDVPVSEVGDLGSGDHVDVTYSFISETIDNTYSAVIVTPADPQGANVNHVTIKDALVVHVEESMVTVAVSPQDSLTIRWCIDAGLPGTVTK